MQSPPNAAVAQAKWQQHMPALTSRLADVSGELSLAVDNGDWTTPAATRPVHEADAQWLAALSGYTHLRLRRRLSIAAVTGTEAVRQAVLELMQVTDQCPALHDMLRDSGQLPVTPETAPPVTAPASP